MNLKCSQHGYVFFFSHIPLVGCGCRVGGDLDFPRTGVLTVGALKGEKRKGHTGSMQQGDDNV